MSEQLFTCPDCGRTYGHADEADRCPCWGCCNECGSGPECLPGCSRKFEARHDDADPVCGECGAPAIGLCRGCEERLLAEADYYENL